MSSHPARDARVHDIKARVRSFPTAQLIHSTFQCFNSLLECDIDAQ
jgi:hypothetical protein